MSTNDTEAIFDGEPDVLDRAADGVQDDGLDEPEED